MGSLIVTVYTDYKEQNELIQRLHTTTKATAQNQSCLFTGVFSYLKREINQQYYDKTW